MVVSVANTRGPSTGPDSATDPISDEQPRVTDHPGLDWLAEFGDLLYGYAMAQSPIPKSPPIWCRRRSLPPCEDNGRFAAIRLEVPG